MDDHLVGVLSNIGIISFVALSAYLLLLTGEISFGQQAFFALGAYAAGIATAMWGWPLTAALVWGAAIGGGAAVLLGVPTLRLHGLYFAIATLALKRLTGPFVLRRVKTDKSIISDLPEKIEMEVVCNLTAEQATLYQAVVDDMMERIEEQRGHRAARPRARHDDQAQAGLQPPGAAAARRDPAGRAVRQARPARGDPRGGARRRREGAAVHPVRRVRRHAARVPVGPVRPGGAVPARRRGQGRPGRDGARFQADEPRRRRCSCSRSRPAAPASR